MNNISNFTNIIAAYTKRSDVAAEKSSKLFYKNTLSNGMEVFDFNVDAIIDKMEHLIIKLDREI